MVGKSQDKARSQGWCPTNTAGRVTPSSQGCTSPSRPSPRLRDDIHHDTLSSSSSSLPHTPKSTSHANRCSRHSGPREGHPYATTLQPSRFGFGWCGKGQNSNYRPVTRSIFLLAHLSSFWGAAETSADSHSLGYT